MELGEAYSKLEYKGYVMYFCSKNREEKFKKKSQKIPIKNETRRTSKA